MVIRCDDEGDDCRVVRKLHRDDGGWRGWGDNSGQVRCDPEGNRCRRAR